MSDLSFKKVMNLIAYIAVICCAIGVMLGKLIPGVIGTIFMEVASILALIITAFVGFFYARSKRNPAFMVIFVISIAVLIAFKIWALI